VQQELQKSLIGLLEAEVEALGYELIEIEMLSGKPAILRLYIDSSAGIDIEDCAKVSRQISVLLDVEDPVPGEYTLEVSSPGTDRPLRTLEHFAKYAGEQAKLKLTQLHQGRKRLKGVLQGVENEAVQILVGDKEYLVPLAIIAKANLAPDYSFK